MSELALHLINKARRNHSHLLDLGRCGLQGFIPAEIAEQLTELTWLKTLILSNAWFEFDDNRSGFVQKKSVNAGTPNTLDSLPEILSRLIGLKKLVCSGQAGENWNIRSLQPLANLTQLEALCCDRNRIFDLRPLANMQRLQLLSCRKNDLEDLSPLSGLSRLRVLSIGQNQVSDLSALGGLQDLAVLSLPKNRVRDLGPLSGLRALQWLDCSENNIRDWSPLADLDGIAMLEHSGNDGAYPEPAPVPYAQTSPPDIVEESAKGYVPERAEPLAMAHNHHPVEQKKFIFISYATEDKDLLQIFRNHLSPLEEKYGVEIWHDEKLKPGSTWEAEIRNKMRASDIILLLVTASFLASDFIKTEELPLAFEQNDAGKAVVVPVILRDCKWQLTRMQELNALPVKGSPILQPGNRDKVWREVVDKIEEMLAPESDLRKTPFP